MKTIGIYGWLGISILILFVSFGICSNLLEYYCRGSNCRNLYEQFMPILSLTQFFLIILSMLYFIYSVSQIRKVEYRKKRILGLLGSLPFLYLLIGMSIGLTY